MTVDRLIELVKLASGGSFMQVERQGPDVPEELKDDTVYINYDGTLDVTELAKLINEENR